MGWWEEVLGGRCQYEGVIIPAIVAVLVRGEDGDERVFRLLEENGFIESSILQNIFNNYYFESISEPLKRFPNAGQCHGPYIQL
jgi:hypothetical protein